MKHLAPLEVCPRDNHYRYLTLRERAKSYEVVLLHQAPGTGKRVTRVVAKIPKYALDIHDAGYQALRNGGSLDSVLRDYGKGLLALATKLQMGTKSG